MRKTGGPRPRLVEDVEALADRASSRGAQRRANDLRAVAEHLRAKEARQVVVDVRPQAIARRRARERGLRPKVLERLRYTAAGLRRAVGRLRRAAGRLRSR
jgi:hypothetical protein